MKKYITHQVTGQILRVRVNPDFNMPPFVVFGRKLHDSSEGQPLLGIDPKPRRSRYTPHIGNKQKMKATRRMLMSEGAALALLA